jgi:MFS_1 like family
VRERMVASALHEFSCARAVTNSFLAVVLVGRAFLALPLLPVFLKYLGLSALEAGLVCAAQIIVEMLLTPVWLLAVRRSGLRRRALVVLGLVLAAALHVCLVFVPPLGQPQVKIF